jgi:hypothetical protein
VAPLQFESTITEAVEAGRLIFGDLLHASP